MCHANKLTRLGAGLACVLFSSLAALGETVWYVDDESALGSTGTSWSSPFRYLQDALGYASAGDEIRVAGGIYHPDRDEAGAVTRGDPTASFELVNGVALRGGYAGPGTPWPDLRHLQAYETILSGDLRIGDGPYSPRDDLNSYQVVTSTGGDSATLLDGFTIAQGRADVAALTGGGMLVGGGSPTIQDCTFIDNTAEYGGGLFNSNGSPTLIGCVFSGNTATISGGGMYNFSMTSAYWATLIGCIFDQNSAENYGGGMRNWDSSTVLIGCTFHYNHCLWYGAGVANGGQSAPTFTNCVFSANRVDTLYAMTECYGGAVSNLEQTQPTFTNCVFTGNIAQTLYPALSFGAALAGGADSNATLTNCTFKNNFANVGDALFNLDNSSASFANCIIWNGGTDEVINAGSGTVTVSYSDVEGGWPGATNIDDDPLFDELRLSSGSPCIDRGDDSVVTAATDLDGHARILCGAVDMGAYEFGMGDPDCDEDVDLTDFASWCLCATGPAAGPYSPGCEVFDFDYDQDVDLTDWAGLQSAFTGP